MSAAQDVLIEGKRIMRGRCASYLGTSCVLAE
jgi:hypothetical protein